MKQLSEKWRMKEMHLLLAEKKKKMKMLLRIFALLLIVTMSLGIAAPVCAEKPKKILPSGISYEEIGSEIEAFVKEHEATMAAMEVAVFDREGIIYQNIFGYTNKEKQITADAESVIEWGSVSKTLIWVSVMQLYEQGDLDLDADIRTYLPEGFLTNLNYDNSITMKNLMNHDAGFQEMLSDLFLENPDDVYALAEQLKLHEPEQIYEPGTVTAYSNWSTGLAAYIVEMISGQSFDEYAKEHIFEPLGMEHTAIRPNLSDNEWVQKKRQELMCYDTDGKLMGDCNYAISLYPVGRCTSTLEDFATYGQAFLKRDGERCPFFEKQETFQEMLSATSYYGDTDIPLNCHGFWTIEYGVSVIGHGGNSDGCSSNLLFNKELGIGAVVMTNQKNEEIFNSSMMELIFGSFQDSELANYTKEAPKGLFRDSRTILKGPMSLQGKISFYTLGKTSLDKFIVYDDSQGVEKVVYAYGNMLKLKPGEYIPMIGLLVLGVAGLLYALCTCLIGGCILTLIRRRNSKKRGIELKKNPYNIWNYSSSGVMLIWFLNLAIIIQQVAAYAPSSHYVWQFAFSGILGMIMLILAGYLFIRFKKIEQPVKTKVKYLVTAFFLLVYVVITLYWETYQFWAL